MIGRRSLLLAGAAFPVAAYGQCVVNAPAVDACRGGVRNAGPAGATLDLNFMFAGSLDPRITFSRASTATYTDASGVIQTAATNAPRWDYAGGSLRGLLIEEARTNICAQNGLTTASINWANVSVTPGATVTAPDGTNTGATHTGTASGSRVLQQNTPAFGTNTVTLSVWLRAPTPVTARLGLGSQGIREILTQNVSVTTAWQRFAITATGVAGDTGSIQSSIYCSDGTSGNTINVWGVQSEIGSFATSYIPTTSVAVTRAVDVATMPTAAWFNANTGSLLAEFLTVNPNSPGTHAGIVRMDDTTDNNYLEMFLAPDHAFFYSKIGAVDQFLVDSGVVATNAPGKVVTTYGGGVWRGAYKGVVYTGSGSATPFPATRMLLGSDSSDANIWKLNGHIRRVQYWPRALSTTEMQQVTT